MAVQTSVLPLGGGATRLSNVYGGASAYRDRVIADGASNYWRLGESAGTTAVDEKGAANGTISGGVTLGAAGALSDGNKAMTFNGATGNIQISGSVAIPLICTIETWLKTTYLASQVAFFSNYGIGTGDTVYAGISAGGVLFCYSPPAAANGATNIATGQWRHIIFVLNGSTVVFYVDGTITDTKALPRATPSAGVAAIGQDNSLAQFWNGALDEVAIYPRALTAPEIAAHYQLAAASLSIPPDLDRPFRQLLLTPDPANTAPILIGDASVGSGPAPGEGIAIAPVPLSYAQRVIADGASNYWRLGETSGLVAVDQVGGANGTISGGVTLGAAGALSDGNKAMTFDGTGLISYADQAVGTTCTLELWVKPSLSGGAYTGLFGNQGGGVTVYYQTQRINCFSTQDNLNTTALPLGVYSHVAIVITAGNGVFYINGVADGTFTGWPGRAFNMIGGTGSKFTGALDEVAIYPRALTAPEIAAHYALGLSAGPPAAALTLGPFDSGPIKLSHLYASGAGALRVLGVPY